jgi:hypothetical protein
VRSWSDTDHYITFRLPLIVLPGDLVVFKIGNGVVPETKGALGAGLGQESKEKKKKKKTKVVVRLGTAGRFA